MLKPMRAINKQQGSSLIEVLIGILILTVGILGMATMQLSAKRIGYDALQRSIAITLSHDIIERMRSNPQALGAYAVVNLGDGTLAEPDNCFDADCTTIQLAARDLWEWEQSLIGASEQIGANSVGGLVNPRACIVRDVDRITVAIAWKGFQSIANPTASDCGEGLGLYGIGDAERQLAFFTTVILR